MKGQAAMGKADHAAWKIKKQLNAVELTPGPKGDKGDTGATGATGATGPAGPSFGAGDGAGAQIGTLLNAPSAGNPTKWLSFNDSGTTRYIPSWT